MLDSFFENDKFKSEKVRSAGQGSIVNTLENSYVAYMTIKACHEQSTMYISSSEVKRSRSQIKRVESFLKGKDKTINTDATWDSAGKKFDTTLGKMLQLGALTGQYNQMLQQRCRLSFMALNSVQMPGTKKKRTKDF